jgi:hypothetical protein
MDHWAILGSMDGGSDGTLWKWRRDGFYNRWCNKRWIIYNSSALIPSFISLTSSLHLSHILITSSISSPRISSSISSHPFFYLITSHTFIYLTSYHLASLHLPHHLASLHLSHHLASLHLSHRISSFISSLRITSSISSFITSSISSFHHFIYLIISQASDRSGIRGAINGEKVESYWIVYTIRLVTSLIKIKLPLRLLLPILLQQLTTIEIDR